MASSPLGGNNGSNAFQGRDGDGGSMRRTKMGAITISSNKQERWSAERRRAESDERGLGTERRMEE